MISKEIYSIYNYIILNAITLVHIYVDSKDLTGEINFASIYARSEDEYGKFEKDISVNGTVFDVQTSGTYYKFNHPLRVSDNTITICRVRKYDKDHPERGYCDFHVTQYELFKEKYSTLPNFSVLYNQHGTEMVQLLAPKSDVRIYFPNTWI